MIVTADSIHQELYKHLVKIDDVLLVGNSTFLYDGIRNHPDLQITKVKKTVFVTSEVYESHTDFLGEFHPHILKNPGIIYPATASLNCLVTNTHIICNQDILAPAILQLAKDTSLQPIHCKQGYIRCTTVALSDSSFITDDPGIYKSLATHFQEVLLIKRGDIHLDHHSYGFFGGCCGLIGNTLYINGDLTNHTDHKAIMDFCIKSNIQIIDTPGKPLKDTGGILIL